MLSVILSPGSRNGTLDLAGLRRCRHLAPAGFVEREPILSRAPGSFVLIPPDTEYGLRIVGDTRARWLAIWRSALNGLFKELEGIGP